jgi:magnesium transporter
MTLIDNAVYVGGQRVATPRNLDETYTLQEAHTGFAWIGLYRPTAGELASVAAEFDLHPLAIEDAAVGHQRSKVERRWAGCWPARPRASSSTSESCTCSPAPTS